MINQPLAPYELNLHKLIHHEGDPSDLGKNLSLHEAFSNLMVTPNPRGDDDWKHGSFDNKTFETLAQMSLQDRARQKPNEKEWYTYPQSIVFLFLCATLVSLLATLGAQKAQEKSKPKRMRAEDFLGDDDSETGRIYYSTTEFTSSSSSRSSETRSKNVGPQMVSLSSSIKDRDRLRRFFLRKGLPDPVGLSERRAKKIIHILELSSILEESEPDSQNKSKKHSKKCCKNDIPGEVKESPQSLNDDQFNGRSVGLQAELSEVLANRENLEKSSKQSEFTVVEMNCEPSIQATSLEEIELTYSDVQREEKKVTKESNQSEADQFNPKMNQENQHE